MHRLAIFACIFILMKVDPSTAQPAEIPKLTVILVIDQFRADFITRYQDLYVEGGLARLIREGAWFKDATYGHAACACACVYLTRTQRYYIRHIRLLVRDHCKFLV